MGTAHLVEMVVAQAEMAMAMEVRETVEVETETKNAGAGQTGAQVGQEAVAIQAADLMGLQS